MEYSAQGTTAAGRYEALVSSRSVYDREAKESSKLTIPSLIPEQTSGTRARIKTPFQATGSRGVNSLFDKEFTPRLPVAWKGVLILALVPDVCSGIRLGMVSLEDSFASLS